MVDVVFWNDAASMHDIPSGLEVCKRNLSGMARMRAE